MVDLGLCSLLNKFIVSFQSMILKWINTHIDG